MGVLVVVRYGSAVSHRNQFVMVLLGFDSFPIIVNRLSKIAGGINQAVRVLIYLFHLGLALKV